LGSRNEKKTYRHCKTEKEELNPTTKGGRGNQLKNLGEGGVLRVGDIQDAINSKKFDKSAGGRKAQKKSRGWQDTVRDPQKNGEGGR